MAKGEKSARKRRYILEKAREVFVRKGFKAVTMQDIIDACGISRGGLYLYFPDVKSIFLEVLAGERPGENAAAVERALMGDASVAEMLGFFLQEQKQSVLDRDGSLGLAESEFFSLYSGEISQLHPLRKRFEEAVRMITRLIELGIRAGEFVCRDPEGTARNIMFVLEGLRAANRTMGVSEADVDRELAFVLKGIAVENGVKRP